MPEAMSVPMRMPVNRRLAVIMAMGLPVTAGVGMIGRVGAAVRMPIVIMRMSHPAPPATPPSPLSGIAPRRQ
jgi:hypothetical protein